MLLTSDSLSDIGRQRKKNEDDYYSNPQTGLFIVADGMGGHPAGEVASKLAVATLRVQLETADFNNPEQLTQRLGQALQHANRTIIRAGKENSLWKGMGTTAAITLIIRGQAFIANIGDSRIYVLHNGELRKCSIDHNPTEPVLLHGTAHNLSHLLTQALGIEQPLEPHLQHFAVHTGDRLLLCTDGLSNQLTDSTIGKLLNQPVPPAQICQQLVATANDRGGFDNITVTVVDIR